MRTRARRRRTVVVSLTVILAAALAWEVTDRGPPPTRGVIGTQLDPRLFAPGACVAFGPTASDRHQTVFLDAGHGGIDPGGVGVTSSGHRVLEAKVALAVETDAMRLLRAKGFRVVVSRTRASTVVRLAPGDVGQGALTLQGSHDDVAARDVCADDAHAAALVGIYFDASAHPTQAGAITTYDADRAFAAANLRLARLVQRDVLVRLNAHGWGIPDDGVLVDSRLGSYVGDRSSGGIAGAAASYDHLLLLGPAAPGFATSPSTMPGAVTEPLYLTDPFEASIAASPVGQQAIASGIATALDQFLPPPAQATR